MAISVKGVQNSGLSSGVKANHDQLQVLVGFVSVKRFWDNYLCGAQAHPGSTQKQCFPLSSGLSEIQGTRFPDDVTEV